MKFGLTTSSVAGQTMQLVGAEDAFTAFQRFYQEDNIEEVLSAFDAVCEGLDLHPGRFPEWFPALRARLSDKLTYDHKELWKILEKKAKAGCYGGNKQAEDLKVLVVGAGPCGLRTAIECQLLGSRTVVVEEKTSFSDNNVLKLWKSGLEDLKQLGVKKLYSRLGFGTIDHISCKVLQTVLLKICCLLGVQIYTGVKLLSLLEPEDEQGWHARLQPEDHEARHFSFDVVVGASGVVHCLDGFNRTREEGPRELTITANFRHEGNSEEGFMTELGDITEPFHKQFFLDMEKELGIRLTRFCYYKDLTHYFQLEVSLDTLLHTGILRERFECRNRLLSKPNINQAKLSKHVLEICRFATRYFSHQLPHANYAVNSDGDQDLAIHDFSSRYISQEASRAVVRKGFPLLMCLVGNSLANYSWEGGLGTARGLLSCLDCAWQVRSWSLQANPMQVLAERESLYSLLGSLTEEGMKASCKTFTINPKTRYRAAGSAKVARDESVVKLYTTDNSEELRYLTAKFLSRTYFDTLSYENLIGRYLALHPPTTLSRANNLWRIILKKSKRSREQVLLQLGKTRQAGEDEELVEQVDRFRIQNTQVENLALSVSNYVSALSAVRTAESQLFSSWAENIQDWQNLENFLQNAESIKERRGRNVECVSEEVETPLKTYAAQFQEVKRRVDKCNFLRIEHNRQTFLLEKMEGEAATSSEGLDAARMRQKKAEEAYHALLQELKQDLPGLYGVRKELFVTSLYQLFVQQKCFHNDLSFTYRDMCDYVLVKLKH